jgi:hypothetical protein
MSAQLGLVLHVQEGNGGLSGWFNNPASGASSTFWVAKAGALEQYVDCTVCAWAQASGNSTYQSIETEGYHDEPLTAAQEATLARLYAWGATTFGWVNALAESPGQKGFGWHGMGGSSWGGHTGCPGDLRKPRRQPILDQAFPAPGPTPGGESDMVLFDPVTGGYWVAWPDGSIYTLAGAPYLGGCNNRTYNPQGFPCVGIAARPDDDGYVLVLDFGAGTGKAHDPRLYNFARNGSGIVA